MKRERVKLRSIGKRIKSLRENHYHIEIAPNEKEYDDIGYTQQEFANEFRVSLDTVKNWEQGYNYPPTDKMIELAEFFSCDYNYLFGKEYKGLSETAQKNLSDLCNEDSRVAELISDLLENKDILYQIKRLSTTNYERIESPLINDFFGNHHADSFRVGQADLLRSHIMQLFLLLWDYINHKRASLSLESLNERLRLFEPEKEKEENTD